MDLDLGHVLRRLAEEGARLKDLGAKAPPAALAGFGRVRLAGRFTGEGLRFEAAWGPP
jgi:hypothetical protein